MCFFSRSVLSSVILWFFKSEANTDAPALTCVLSNDQQVATVPAANRSEIVGKLMRT